MITFMCIHCNEELSVPDNTAGKKGKCPHCGQIVQIPTASTVPEESAPAGEGTREEPDFASPVPREKASRDRDRDRDRERERDEEEYDRGREEQLAPEPAPAGPTLLRPELEFALLGLVLGMSSMICVEGTVFIRPISLFGTIMLGLGRLGLASFGIVLGMLGMGRSNRYRGTGWMSNLVAVILCATSAVLNLVMLIVSFTGSMSSGGSPMRPVP
jgi:hypothetical protein